MANCAEHHPQQPCLPYTPAKEEKSRKKRRRKKVHQIMEPVPRPTTGPLLHVGYLDDPLTSCPIFPSLFVGFSSLTHSLTELVSRLLAHAFCGYRPRWTLECVDNKPLDQALPPQLGYLYYKKPALFSPCASIPTLLSSPSHFTLASTQPDHSLSR